MRYFILRALAFVLVPVLIFNLLFFEYVLHTRKMSDIDYEGGLKLKFARLYNNRNRDKIILIGGSNLGMGFNSAELSTRFSHYTVINYGQRFHYGIEFYLREIKPWIKENDIIVLVPEYQLLLDGYITDRQLNEIYFENLNTQKLTYNEIFHMLPYTLEYMKRRYKFRNKTENDIKDHNKKSGFNEYGDLVCHWSMNPIRPLPIYDVPSSFQISNHTLREIESFVSYCKQKKISLITIPPAYAQSSFDISGKIIEWNKELFNKMGIPFQCSPEAFRFNDSLFFDTPYHLLREGATKKAMLLGEVIFNSHIPLIK